MKPVANVASLFVLVTVSLACCTSPTSPQTAAVPPQDTTAIAPPTVQRSTPTVDKSTQVKDAHGNFLGYVMNSSASGLEIFTPKGYLVSLDWNGSMIDGVAVFTENDGSGIMFCQWAKDYHLSGFVTSIQGQPYVAASLDGNGFAIADPSITSYQSYYFDGAVANVPTTPVLDSYSAYPLKKVQLEDIGVPSSIPLPMQIVTQ